MKFIELLFLALTDPQVDQLIIMLDNYLELLTDAIKAVWLVAAPFLLGYLAYRQAINRRELDRNTEVSVKAFDAANSHNEKIVVLTEQIANKAIPQNVPGSTAENPLHMVSENTEKNPVPVKPVEP